MTHRTAPGVDGPVILAAWCETCGQEAMPMRDGSCGWCDRLIVPPADALPGSAAVRSARITDDEIVVELRAVAARIGRAPYASEWDRSRWAPSYSTIFRRFGTWSAALEAAGLA